STRPSTAAIGRVVAVEQIPAGVELMLGLTRDADFGAIVTVAAGGVFTEIMAESHTAVVPFNRARARTLIERMWAGRLLSHSRGIDGVAKEAVIDAIMALQELAVSEPRVLEIDINPLILAA